MAAKRIVVSHATILGVSRGTLATVRAFILQAVDMKMPHSVAVKTNS